jgi:hypothetical protein
MEDPKDTPVNGPGSPTGNPFPPGTPGNPNPPVNATEPPKPQHVPALQTTDDGRYVLAHPVSGGFDWWEINDMQKMYAVVTVQASFPEAEQVARFAFDKLNAPKPQPRGPKKHHAPRDKE